MSSALLPALLALQVFSICGGSLLLNGAVGESIVLPTGAERSYKGGLMLWKRKDINIIKSVKNTVEINPNFIGRLTMNDETGALNISNLREEDSGEYDFSGIASAELIPPKKVQLQVYVFVSVGSQVALSWRRNGQNIAGAENRTTLTASPTLAEEIYVCTATNPISSQSNSVTVKPCRVPPGLSLCALMSVLFSIGLVAMVSAVIAVNIRERCSRGKLGLGKEDTSVRGEARIDI